MINKYFLEENGLIKYKILIEVVFFYIISIHG